MYIQILYTVPVFLKNTNISNFYTAPTVLTDPNKHTHPNHHPAICCK